VAGFLRGLENACREASAKGLKILRERLSLWRSWRLLFGKGDAPRDFQNEIETKLRESFQPQVEHAIRLLETDLRGLWPQLHDLLDDRLGSELRGRVPQTAPDFAQQRRELLQSIELTLMEKASGKSIEETLAAMFQ